MQSYEIIATFAKNNNEMTEARDIAGFVLPFTAGILTATLVSQRIQHITFPIPICIASACIISLLHPPHRKAGPFLSWVLLVMLAFACGMFTGLSDSLLSMSDIEGTGPISVSAARFCSGLENTIDSIDFRDERTSGLLKALITGNRAHLTKETASAFRDSGASHILALSGLHLGIIYGIITKLLSALGHGSISQKLKSIMTILFCGFYTFAVGAGASIVRAFLFILLGECAAMTGRARNMPQIFFAALFLQLLSDAGSIKDIGFQLSYAAMAGIAFIYPSLKRVWPEENRGAGILKWIWNTSALSIACQITTGPIAWIYFGTFPQYFLLTNLISLPLTGLIMPVSLLTIVLESCGICPDAAIRFTELLTNTLTGALEIISTM